MSASLWECVHADMAVRAPGRSQPPHAGRCRFKAGLTGPAKVTECNSMNSHCALHAQFFSLFLLSAALAPRAADGYKLGSDSLVQDSVPRCVLAKHSTTNSNSAMAATTGNMAAPFFRIHSGGSGGIINRELAPA
jgi:hypothetical protein